jgi:hypothetical protein
VNVNRQLSKRWECTPFSWWNEEIATPADENILHNSVSVALPDTVASEVFTGHRQTGSNEVSYRLLV